MVSSVHSRSNRSDRLFSPGLSPKNYWGTEFMRRERSPRLLQTQKVQRARNRKRGQEERCGVGISALEICDRISGDKVLR